LRKTLLTRSLVNPAVASRKPRPKVVVAPPVATFLLLEAPRHLEGRWGGGQDYHIEKASALAAALKSFPGHFPGLFMYTGTNLENQPPPTDRASVEHPYFECEPPR
jgi:hypothetical protein